MSDLGLKIKILASSQEAVKSFADLKSSVVAARTELSAAQTRATELARELQATTTPSNRLTTAFERAKVEAGALKNALQLKERALEQSRRALTAQGVDVTQLAASYTRLKDAVGQTQRAISQAATLHDARQTLGLRPFAAVRSEIEQVKAALATLKTSGQLSMGEFAQASLRAEQRIAELKRETNGVIGTLDRMRGAVATFAAAAAAVGGTIQQASAFESALTRVEKVAGLDAGGLAQVAAIIRALSREIPLTVEGLAEIATAAGQLNLPVAQYEAFIRLVAQSASAFDILPQEAGDAFAQLTNIFKLPLDDLRLVGDSINQLADSIANVTERDLIAVTARVASTGKAFGLTAQQLNALGATLLSLGKPPEQAANAIEALLARLQGAAAQGEKFQEALVAIGTDAEQLARSIAANPQRALLDFLRLLKQADAQQRVIAATELFGEQYRGEVLAVVDAMDGYVAALRSVDQGHQYAGSIQRAFRAGLDDQTSRWQLLVNAVREAAEAIGRIFLPVVKRVTDGLASVAQSLSDLAREFPQLSGAVTVFAALAASLTTLRVIATGVKLLFAGLLAPLAGSVASASTTLTGLGGLLTRLAGGPVGLAITAVGSLAAAWSAVGREARAAQTAQQDAISRANAALQQRRDQALVESAGGNPLAPQQVELGQLYARERKTISDLQAQQKAVGTGFGAQGIARDLAAAQQRAAQLLDKLNELAAEVARRPAPATPAAASSAAAIGTTPATGRQLDARLTRRYTNTDAVTEEDKAIFRARIIEKANAAGVDPALALGIVENESSFQPGAIGYDQYGRPQGRGLFQTVPSTFKGYGRGGDFFVPEDNITAGINYLADLKRRFGPNPYEMLKEYRGYGSHGVTQKKYDAYFKAIATSAERFGSRYDLSGIETAAAARQQIPDDDRELLERTRAQDERNEQAQLDRNARLRQAALDTRQQILDDFKAAADQQRAYQETLDAAADADFQRRQDTQKQFLTDAYEQKLLSARDYYAGLQKLADDDLQRSLNRIDDELAAEQQKLAALSDADTRYWETKQRIAELTGQRSAAQGAFRTESRQITTAATAAQADAAKAPSNDIARFADDFNQRLGDMSQFAFTAASNMQSAFADFFESGMRGTESLGLAFAKMAQRIAAEIAAMMVTKAIVSFIGLLGSAFGGGTGAVAGAATGGATQGLASGGIIRGAGSGTSDSIHTALPAGSFILRAAATKALMAQPLAVGGPVKALASGGIVPVRVSAGEFFVPPPAVRRIGLPALEALNRAGASRAFADGGLVSGGDTHLGDIITLNMPVSVHETAGKQGDETGMPARDKAAALQRELRNAVDARIIELQRPGGLLWGAGRNG